MTAATREVSTEPSRCAFARWQRERRAAGIEDYLFIGGDRMSARLAAIRLGVSERTVTRYRAALRRAA